MLWQRRSSSGAEAAPACRNPAAVPRGSPAMTPKKPVPVRTVVVDDVDDMRELLRLLLEREDHFTVVAEAENGHSGVTAVRAHRPDLVLLDITMPVMDGMQALELIRREVPSAVVVMLSSCDVSSQEAKACTALGAHGYLRKGEHLHQIPDELRAIVHATHRLS